MTQRRLPTSRDGHRVEVVYDEDFGIITAHLDDTGAIVMTMNG